MMKVDVKIPKLGLTVTEAQIVEWHKQVGEPVARDETLCVIDVDKSSVELPSPASGIVSEIIGQIGNDYAVGDVIAVVSSGG